MKIFIRFFLILVLTTLPAVLANSAPISVNDTNIIVENEKNNYYTEKKSDTQLLYIPKSQDSAGNINIQEKFESTAPNIVEKQSGNIIVDSNETSLDNKTENKKNKRSEKNASSQNQKKEKKNMNLEISDIKDGILSESTRRISAIYPDDEGILNNAYPGYRGTNQLVIYTRSFGRTTGTNEFGKEAVVEDGIVTRLTGANSNIPRDGYVISGHGTAKKWISDNLKIGTKIEIYDRQIRAYTTIDSYRYFAKSKINEVEQILISTKSDSSNRDDKYVYYYLKKAKQQYKKSLKDNNQNALNCAKEAAENAIMAYHYTVPFVKNELKGVWIRPTQKNAAEVQKTLDEIKSAGINNVFLETYYHGRTIFPSKVMEAYGFEKQNPEFNFDVLSAWINEAHKRKIKVHTWFESFYVGNKSPESYPNSILAVKPDWQNKTRQKADYEGYVSHPNEHNGYFLDPANPDVVNFVLSLINEIVNRYDVDGVNIDYVRYPNIQKENYRNQWGYTPYAREEFKQMYDIDPLEIEPNSSKWDEWCEYRRDKITEYVQKASLIVRSRKKLVTAVVFPDYKVSLQTKHQDWARWINRRYLDAITPLILTADDELAKSMLEEIKRKTGNDAQVFPGLFAGFIESDPEDLLRQIHIIRKLKLSGVILFDWAHLNDKYLNVLKTSAFKEKTY